MPRRNSKIKVTATAMARESQRSKARYRRRVREQHPSRSIARTVAEGSHDGR